MILEGTRALTNWLNGTHGPNAQLAASGSAWIAGVGDTLPVPVNLIADDTRNELVANYAGSTNQNGGLADALTQAFPILMVAGYQVAQMDPYSRVLNNSMTGQITLLVQYVNYNPQAHIGTADAFRTMRAVEASVWAWGRDEFANQKEYAGVQIGVCTNWQVSQPQTPTADGLITMGLLFTFEARKAL